METIITPATLKFIEEWNNPFSYVMAHTSGSTGTPKEIQLSKTDMLASAHATIRFFGLTTNSHLHLPLSPDYIAGKMHIVRALEAKCKLTVEEPTGHPLNCFGPESNVRITLLPIVPSQVDGILSAGASNIVENLIIGGAPLSSTDEQRILNSGIRAFATYGMTETCSHVALRRLGTEKFIALPGFRFSTDSRSCLTIDSSTLSFGRLMTNDIVDLIDEKTFRWVGRFDNIINSGGLKISPEETERQISSLIPSESNFYLTSRRSERWGEELVMITDMPGPYEELLGLIKKKIGSRQAPKEIIFDPEICFTSSRKIIRKKF